MERASESPLDHHFAEMVQEEVCTLEGAPGVPQEV